MNKLIVSVHIDHMQWSDLDNHTKRCTSSSIDQTSWSATLGRFRFIPSTRMCSLELGTAGSPHLVQPINSHPTFYICKKSRKLYIEFFFKEFEEKIHRSSKHFLWGLENWSYEGVGFIQFKKTVRGVWKNVHTKWKMFTWYKIIQGETKIG